MIIPASVVAETWIPFSVVLLVELFVCIVFVQHLASRKRRECGSFAVSALGLFFALLTSSLLPVDIFLVSFAKDQHGHFKSWAATKEKRDNISDLMQYSYYALYGMDVLFVFAILPFVFFYNQSRDEDEEDRGTYMTSRCMSAFKWTVGFILFAGLLLLMGAVIPLRDNPRGNSTDIDDLKKLFPELTANKGESTIAMVLNILMLIGLFFLCFYGAFGMATMPISWIFGKLSFQSTRDELLTNEQALRIKSESARKRGARREMNRLEGELNDTRRQLDLLNKMEARCCSSCTLFIRPFQVIFGLFFLAVSVFIVAVIFTTSLNRLLRGEGYKYGYVISGSDSWLNPFDWVLVQLQLVFPMDYVLIVFILVYLVMCTAAGIVRIGIRLCVVKLYRIRPRKTKPEALLFLVYILMFSILAVNVLFYSIAPGYFTYGTQTWMNSTSEEVIKCANEVDIDECVPTRSADVLLRYMYKWWVFGFCYYWANWFFVAVFLLGFIYRCARGRSRATAVEFEAGYDSEESLSDDQDPLLPSYRP